jgi:hypothetical protein
VVPAELAEVTAVIPVGAAPHEDATQIPAFTRRRSAVFPTLETVAVVAKLVLVGAE